MSRGLLLGFLILGCRPTGLRPIDAELRAAPDRVDFGRPWTQTTARRTLTVTNLTRREARVELSLSGAVFRTAPVERLPPGETTVALDASADAAGLVEGALSIAVEGAEALVIPLRVTFVEPPDCGASSECATLRFDRTTSQCVVEALADGLPCGQSDRCLSDGRCVSGECRGVAVSCDDGDPCTTDLCETVRGCVAVPRACPAPSPCLAGRCAPDGGCTGTPVADGLRCGDLASDSCTAVGICLSGQCVERDPPDGFRCAEATPCRAEGRCIGDVCFRPPGSPLASAWDLGGPTMDGGVGDQWSDLFIAAGSRVALSSYFATPPLVNAGGGRVRLGGPRTLARRRSLRVSAHGGRAGDQLPSLLSRRARRRGSACRGSIDRGPHLPVLQSPPLVRSRRGSAGEPLSRLHAERAHLPSVA